MTFLLHESRLVDGLDFLEWQCRTNDIDRTWSPVLVVLAFPDKLSLELGKRVGIVGTVVG